MGPDPSLSAPGCPECVSVEAATCSGCRVSGGVGGAALSAQALALILLSLTSREFCRWAGGKTFFLSVLREHPSSLVLPRRVAGVFLLLEASMLTSEFSTIFENYQKPNLREDPI